MGVIAMNGFFILSRSLEVEPHNQMQFIFIFKTPFFESSRHFADDTVNCWVNSGHIWLLNHDMATHHRQLKI